MKIEKIFEQISIKFRDFLLNQDEFGTNCAAEKQTKIPVEIYVSADIKKVNYRPIISVN